MVESSFTNEVAVCSNPVDVTQISDIALVLSKEFLEIQTIVECRFTLKHVRGMMRIYSIRLLNLIEPKRKVLKVCKYKVKAFLFRLEGMT